MHLAAPAEGPHVRVETGVRSGDVISVHYDPMIAKLIVWDRDRARAVQRLRRALAQYEIVGVTTNLAFLGAIAAHPAFGAGALDTGFIGRHGTALFQPPEPAGRDVLAAAALAVLLDRQRKVAASAALSADPWSPWTLANGWRLNGDGHQDLVFRDGETKRQIRVRSRRKGGFELDLPEGSVALDGDEDEAGALGYSIDGVKLQARVVRLGADLVIIRGGVNHRLTLIDPLVPERIEAAISGNLMAPMPGRITQILTSAGAEVERGAALLVLEAMKMEHTIAAPADGIIAAVRCSIGDLVEDGAELISFVPPREG